MEQRTDKAPRKQKPRPQRLIPVHDGHQQQHPHSASSSSNLATHTDSHSSDQPHLIPSPTGQLASPYGKATNTAVPSPAFQFSAFYPPAPPSAPHEGEADRSASHEAGAILRNGRLILPPTLAQDAKSQWENIHVASQQNPGVGALQWHSPRDHDKFSGFDKFNVHDGLVFCALPKLSERVEKQPVLEAGLNLTRVDAPALRLSRELQGMLSTAPGVYGTIRAADPAVEKYDSHLVRVMKQSSNKNRSYVVHYSGKGYAPSPGDGKAWLADRRGFISFDIYDMMNPYSMLCRKLMTELISLQEKHQMLLDRYEACAYPSDGEYYSDTGDSQLTDYSASDYQGEDDRSHEYEMGSYDPNGSAHETASSVSERSSRSHQSRSPCSPKGHGQQLPPSHGAVGATDNTVAEQRSHSPSRSPVQRSNDDEQSHPFGVCASNKRISVAADANDGEDMDKTLMQGDTEKQSGNLQAQGYQVAERQQQQHQEHQQQQQYGHGHDEQVRDDSRAEDDDSYTSSEDYTSNCSSDDNTITQLESLLDENEHDMRTLEQQIEKQRTLASTFFRERPSSSLVFIADCDNAASLFAEHLRKPSNWDFFADDNYRGSGNLATYEEEWERLQLDDPIVFASCNVGEVMQMTHNNGLPADIFPKCLLMENEMILQQVLLTEPISNIRPEIVERIKNFPGDLTSSQEIRRLIEFNFDLIISQIAWDTLPSNCYRWCFGKRTFVGHLIKGMLLAQRVMGRIQLHPKMWPPIPDAQSHPLWVRFNQFVIDILSGDRKTPAPAAMLHTALVEVHRVLATSCKTSRITHAPALASVLNVPHPPFEIISAVLEDILTQPLFVKEQFVHSSLPTLVIHRPDVIKASIYGEIVFLCVAINPSLVEPFSFERNRMLGRADYIPSAAVNATTPETVFMRLCRLAMETLPGGIGCNVEAMYTEVSRSEHRVELNQDTLKPTSLAHVLLSLGLCLISSSYTTSSAHPYAQSALPNQLYSDITSPRKLAHVALLLLHHRHTFLKRAAVFLLYNIFEKQADVANAFCASETTLNELVKLCLDEEDIWVKALCVRILTIFLEKAQKKEIAHFKSYLRLGHHCSRHPSFLVRAEFAKFTYSVVMFFSHPILKKASSRLFDKELQEDKPSVGMFPMFLIQGLRDPYPGVVAWMIHAFAILASSSEFMRLRDAAVASLDTAAKVQKRTFRHQDCVRQTPEGGHLQYQRRGTKQSSSRASASADSVRTQEDGVPEESGGYDADDDIDEYDDDEDDEYESDSEDLQRSSTHHNRPVSTSRDAVHSSPVTTSNSIGSSMNVHQNALDRAWAYETDSSATEAHLIVGKGVPGFGLGDGPATNTKRRKKPNAAPLPASQAQQAPLAYESVEVAPFPLGLTPGDIIDAGTVYHLPWSSAYSDMPGLGGENTGVFVLDDCIALVRQLRSALDKSRERFQQLHRLVMEYESTFPAKLPQIPPPCECSRCVPHSEVSESLSSLYHGQDHLGLGHSLDTIASVSTSGHKMSTGNSEQSHSRSTTKGALQHVSHPSPLQSMHSNQPQALHQTQQQNVDANGVVTHQSHPPVQPQHNQHLLVASPSQHSTDFTSVHDTDDAGDRESQYHPQHGWFLDGVLTGHSRNDFLFRTWISGLNSPSMRQVATQTATRVLHAYLKEDVDESMFADEFLEAHNVLEKLMGIPASVHSVHEAWVRNRDPKHGTELFRIASSAGSRHHAHLLDLMVLRLLNRHRSRSLSAGEADRAVPAQKPPSWTTWFHQESKLMFENQTSPAFDISTIERRVQLTMLSKTLPSPSDDITPTDPDATLVPSHARQRRTLLFDDDDDDDDDDAGANGDDGDTLGNNADDGENSLWQKTMLEPVKLEVEETCVRMCPCPSSHRVVVCTSLGRCLVTDLSSRKPSVTSSFQIPIPSAHSITDLLAYGDDEPTLFAALSTGVVLAYKPMTQENENEELGLNEHSAAFSQCPPASARTRQGAAPHYTLCGVVGAAARHPTQTKLLWRSSSNALLYYSPSVILEYNYHTYAAKEIHRIKDPAGGPLVDVCEHPLTRSLASITMRGSFMIHDNRNHGRALSATFDSPGSVIAMSMPAVSGYHVIEASDGGLVRLFDLRNLASPVETHTLRRLAAGEKMTSYVTQDYGQLTATTSTGGDIMVHSNVDAAPLLAGSGAINGSPCVQIAFNARAAFLYGLHENGHVVAYGNGTHRDQPVGTAQSSRDDAAEWMPMDIASLLS